MSNGLVEHLRDQWVVSMSGSGLGYLVDLGDRFVEPERPLVLLSETELSQMGELLRIVAGSLSKDRRSEERSPSCRPSRWSSADLVLP